jgi:hypothetical protein
MFKMLEEIPKERRNAYLVEIAECLTGGGV